jgi:hypothetical protein
MCLAVDPSSDDDASATKPKRKKSIFFKDQGMSRKLKEMVQPVQGMKWLNVLGRGPLPGYAPGFSCAA